MLSRPIVQTLLSLLSYNEDKRRYAVLHASKCPRKISHLKDRETLVAIASDLLFCSTPLYTDFPTRSNTLVGTIGCTEKVAASNIMLNCALFPLLLSPSISALKLSNRWSHLMESEDTFMHHLNKLLQAPQNLPPMTSHRGNNNGNNGNNSNDGNNGNNNNPTNHEINSLIHGNVRRSAKSIYELYRNGRLSRAFNRLSQCVENACNGHSRTPSPINPYDKAVELHPNPVTPDGFPADILETTPTGLAESEFVVNKMRDFLQLNPHQVLELLPDELINDDCIIQAAAGMNGGAAPGPYADASDIWLGIIDHARETGNLTFIRRFCEYIRACLRGALPIGAYKIMQDCKLILLGKKDGGARPIAMGSFLVKLCGRILVRINTEKSRVFHNFLQIGATNTTAAIEIPIHAARLMLRMRPHYAHIKFDIKSAFNTIPLQLVFRAVMDHFPTFGPFIARMYGTPSALWMQGVDINNNFVQNSIVQITCSTGVHQGDTAGMNLFCIGFQAPLLLLYLKLKSILPHVEIHISVDKPPVDGFDGIIIGYADDVYAIIPAHLVVELIVYFRDVVAPSHGITLSIPKINVFILPQTDPLIIQSIRDLNVTVVFDGIEVMGAPIGTKEFVERSCIEKVESLRPLAVGLTALAQSIIKPFPRNMAAMCIQLLRSCFATKLSHLLRTIPECLSKQALTYRFDSLIRETAMAIILGHALPLESSLTSFLPMRVALNSADNIMERVIHLPQIGLGLPSLELSAAGAIRASLASCIPFLAKYQAVLGMNLNLEVDPDEPGRTSDPLVVSRLLPDNIAPFMTGCPPTFLTAERLAVSAGTMSEYFDQRGSLQHLITSLHTTAMIAWTLQDLDKLVHGYAKSTDTQATGRQIIPAQVNVTRNAGLYCARMKLSRLIFNASRGSFEFLRHGSPAGYTMSHEAYRVALMLRLCLSSPSLFTKYTNNPTDLVPEQSNDAFRARQCNGCSSFVMWTPTLSHALTCTSAGTHTFRHNKVVNFIFDQLKRAGLILSPANGAKEPQVFPVDPITGKENQHRPDFILYEYPFASLDKLHLSNPTLDAIKNMADPPQTVTVMFDVFFADILPSLNIYPPETQGSITRTRTRTVADRQSLTLANFPHNAELLSRSQQAQRKLSKYAPFVEVYKRTHGVEVVFIPLHFDALGWASKDTTSFLNYIFELEKKRDSDYPVTEDPHQEQSEIDNYSIVSKRWRELSTIIISGTCSNALANLRNAAFFRPPRSTATTFVPRASTSSLQSPANIESTTSSQPAAIVVTNASSQPPTSTTSSPPVPLPQSGGPNAGCHTQISSSSTGQPSSAGLHDELCTNPPTQVPPATPVATGRSPSTALRVPPNLGSRTPPTEARRSRRLNAQLTMSAQRPLEHDQVQVSNNDSSGLTAPLADLHIDGTNVTDSIVASNTRVNQELNNPSDAVSSSLRSQRNRRISSRLDPSQFDFSSDSS